MFTLSYQEQRQIQEKLQAEANRERLLKSQLKGQPGLSLRELRGFWKMIASFVF